MHPSLGPPPSLGRYTVTYTTQLPSKRPLSPRPLCVSDNLYFSYSIISGMGRQNQPNDKEGGRRVSCLGPTTEPVPSPTDGLSPDDDDGRILKKLDCRCHVAGGGGVMWRAIEAILPSFPPSLLLARSVIAVVALQFTNSSAGSCSTKIGGGGGKKALFETRQSVTA